MIIEDALYAALNGEVIIKKSVENYLDLYSDYKCTWINLVRYRDGVKSGELNYLNKNYKFRVNNGEIIINEEVLFYMYRVIIKNGCVKGLLLDNLTKDEAIKFCDEHDWVYKDEDNLEWDLLFEKIV